ncbi:MAG: hypothetical protein ABFD50_12750 [Smithella sp.]
MKVRKLSTGVTIEVGDMIKNDHGFGTNWFKVFRVTPKYAVVKYNENAEGRFRRVVESNGYIKEAGNTDIWSQSRYSAWRPVTVEVEKKEGEQNA